MGSYKGFSRVLSAWRGGGKRRLKNDRTDGKTLWYHGNAILWRDEDGAEWGSLAGWNTTTTRGRLNQAGLGVYMGRSREPHLHITNPISLTYCDWVVVPISAHTKIKLSDAKWRSGGLPGASVLRCADHLYADSLSTTQKRVLTGRVNRGGYLCLPDTLSLISDLRPFPSSGQHTVMAYTPSERNLRFPLARVAWAYILSKFRMIDQHGRHITDISELEGDGMLMVDKRAEYAKDRIAGAKDIADIAADIDSTEHV